MVSPLCRAQSESADVRDGTVRDGTGHWTGQNRTARYGTGQDQADDGMGQDRTGQERRAVLGLLGALFGAVALAEVLRRFGGRTDDFGLSCDCGTGDQMCDARKDHRPLEGQVE